jgi:hypothetical protein
MYCAGGAGGQWLSPPGPPPIGPVHGPDPGYPEGGVGCEPYTIAVEVTYVVVYSVVVMEYVEPLEVYGVQGTVLVIVSVVV